MHTARRSVRRQGLEFHLDGGKGLLEHAPMSVDAGPAEVVSESGLRQFEGFSTIEPRPLPGRERRTRGGPAPRGLFLLELHLLRFETASHLSILPACARDG